MLSVCQCFPSFPRALLVILSCVCPPSWSQSPLYDESCVVPPSIPPMVADPITQAPVGTDSCSYRTFLPDMLWSSQQQVALFTFQPESWNIDSSERSKVLRCAAQVLSRLSWFAAPVDCLSPQCPTPVV